MKTMEKKETQMAKKRASRMTDAEKEVWTAEVLAKRKATIAPIILDGVAWKEILHGKETRIDIFERLNRAAGAMGARGPEVWKRYFAKPLDLIRGLPENGTTEAILQVMHSVIVDALADQLVELRARHRRIGELIEMTEAYLREEKVKS